MTDAAEHPTESLGLFALDALDDVEAARVRRHLAGCAACDEEVAMLQEDAASLSDVEVPVPAHVRHRVLAVTDQRQPGRSRRVWRWVAAAAVAVVVGVGGAVVWRVVDASSPVVNQTDSMIEEVLAAPDMQKATGSMGDATVKAMYAPSMRATVVTTENLPAAPGAMGYQVWITVGGEMKSAGMVQPQRASSVLMTDMDRPADVSVSLEPDTGSDKPTSRPLLSFPMPR